MAKLYPPVIEGTIPAFYGTTLVVPFSMNRAVAKSDIKGFSLKIKTVQTNTFIKNLTSTNYTTSEVNFDITDLSLVAGQYYKLQLAYISNDSYSTIGYYSTVGVIKYYGEEGPKIYVDGLFNKNSNIFTGSYVGVFEHQDDPMEKVAQYRFIIQESDGTIVTDTGWLIHNTINDINSLSSTDNFKYDDELENDKVYYLYYKVITSNNMECSTCGYRILQKNSVGLGLNIGLFAENNFDNGYISIKITDVDEETTLNGSFEIARQNIKNPKHWEPIFIFVLQGEEPGKTSWKDFTVEQGETYRYCIRQFNSSNVYSDRVISNEVYADFEDAFLFDGQRQLKIRYNPRVSSFKNDILESKTDTIGSKYPFIFRNGHVNYKEFPISGLISYWSDEENLFMSAEDVDIFDGEKLYRKEDLPWNLKTTDLVNYNIAAERRFKLEALEWLTNGKPKLFRSPSEGNYIVRLLNTTLTPTDTVGRMLHTFNCTAYEVSEINYDALAGYGFIKSTLTDEESQNVYYRSVPLGWQGHKSETYILTEDTFPRTNKEYFYKQDDKYIKLNFDEIELDEEKVSLFNSYKNADIPNLYEIDYMPIITGKNKCYPIDENGCVELLTNPYNKNEVIKALTIRFEDMDSTDIVYINGEKRMIGSTGVYNLDNGDVINSVKVRTVADYYQDDYAADYEAYQSNISFFENGISEIQQEIDKKTLELENAEAEINKYVNEVQTSEEIERMVEQRDALRNEISALSKAIRQLTKEIILKKFEIEEKNNELGYLGMDASELEAEIIAIEKSITGYGIDSHIFPTDGEGNYGLRFNPDAMNDWTGQWETWEQLTNWANLFNRDNADGKYIKVKGKLGVVLNEDGEPVDTEGVYKTLPLNPNEFDAYRVITKGTYAGIPYDEGDLVAYLKDPDTNVLSWIGGKRLRILEIKSKIDDIDKKMNALNVEIADAKSQYENYTYNEKIGEEAIHQKEVDNSARINFINKIEKIYNETLIIRDAQAKMRAYNSILKDIGAGSPAKSIPELNLKSWNYKHAFNKTYGHYFTEVNGNAAKTDWESKFITKAIAKIKGDDKKTYGLTYLNNEKEKIQKPLKENSIPLTQEDCDKKLEEIENRLKELEEQEKELWDSEYYSEGSTETYDNIIKERSDLITLQTKYQNYLKDNKEAYDKINDLLEKIKKLQEVITDLEKIHTAIKPLFSLPKTVKEDDLKIDWTYFLEEYGKSTSKTKIQDKPDSIKFSTSELSKSDLTAETGIVNQLINANESVGKENVHNLGYYKYGYLLVKEEDFDKEDTYYKFSPGVVDWDVYEVKEWEEGICEKNKYLDYYKYTDIKTLWHALRFQKNKLDEDQYYDMLSIKEEYEKSFELITKYESYESNVDNWNGEIESIKQNEIKNLCNEINNIKEIISDKEEGVERDKSEIDAVIETLQQELEDLQKEQQDDQLSLSNATETLDALLTSIEEELIALKDAGIAELNIRKEAIETELNELIISLKKLKNTLTNYIATEEPDKRNYIYGNTWDNDILNDYNGLFTYSYIDEYNNTFDLVSGQNLLDIPCKQINSFDTSKNIVEDLTDSRTEVMDILQMHAELKQIENIYLLSDQQSMGLLSSGNIENIIPPSVIKQHFSLNRNDTLNDDELNLIENPVYIYQIFPILTHNSAEMHGNESGILYGFVENKDDISTKNNINNNFIRIDVAENEDKAEWHAPIFLFVEGSEDDTKFYTVDLFNQNEYNTFANQRILYRRDEDGVLQRVIFGQYNPEEKYYTRGKQYIHVTYHRNELYYSDLSLYEILRDEHTGKYYLNMTNPYYNFTNKDMNGYFLVYDNEKNGFKITNGYSSKIYINTGVKDVEISMENGELYNKNGEVLQPYLDLSTTQEFKTELIPEVTDIYVGNGIILNLSYHARQVDYTIEGNNTSLKIAKQKWEDAIKEYTDYFYTKTDRDSYSFNEQDLYWNSLLNASDEEWNNELYGYDEPDTGEHHEGIEEKRQKIDTTYNAYLKELQNALDMREAQRSWEKYQEVSNNE